MTAGESGERNKRSASKQKLLEQIQGWRRRVETARQAGDDELVERGLVFLRECQNELAKLEEFEL